MNLILIIVGIVGIVTMIWFINHFLDYIKDYQAEPYYQRRRNYRLRLKIKQYKKAKRQKN